MRQRYGGLPADEESGEKPTRVSSNRAAYEAGLAKVALRSSTATKLAVFTRNLSSALSPQVSVLYNRVGLLWATLVGVSVVLAVWLLLVSPLSTSNADFVAPLAPDFCYNCATAAPQPAQPFTLPMSVLVLSACGRGIVRDTVRQTWAASAAERSVAVRFVVGVPHTDAACKAALAQENESFPGSIIAVNVDANGVASLMSLAGGAAPGADAADASRAAAAAAFAPRRPAVDVQMSSSVLLAALTTLQAPGAVLLAPDDVYVHMSALRAQLAAFDAPSVPTRFSTALKSEMSIIARFTPTSSPAEAARVSRVADTFPAVAGAPTNYTALPFAMLPQSMRQPSIVSNCVLLSSAVRNYIVSMSASLASASSDRWEHAIITWLAHLQVNRIHALGMMATAMDATRPRPPSWPLFTVKAPYMSSLVPGLSEALDEEGNPMQLPHNTWKQEVAAGVSMMRAVEDTASRIFLLGLREKRNGVMQATCCAPPKV